MIQFTHKTHPRAQWIKIKIETTGEVVVVTPPEFPEETIAQFVKEHQIWITETKAKMEQRQQFGETPTHLYIFGKQYTKKLIANAGFDRGVWINGPDVIINLPDMDLKQNDTKIKQHTYIDRFLKNTAEQYLIPRTHQIGAMMSIDFGRVTLKQQKTRWGSCSSQGNLNFNWRLVHTPPEVIDYVIIHELAHRRHMDHSRAFWNLVAQYDPAHQQHRGWLKRHGMAVG